MLVEGYTKTGEECAWTLDDMNKFRESYMANEENHKKFNAYYKKNIAIIVGMWEYNTKRAGRPWKPYNGGTGSLQERLAHQAMVCLLLNLHHSPLWKKIAEMQEEED